MAKKIDLGSKMSSPTAGMDVAKSEKAQPKVSYPSMYVQKNGDDGFDSVPKHPDGFDFHGHGRVMSHSVKTDKDGKKSHTMEMEVHHITPVEGSKAGENEDPGESLAGELKKIEKKKSTPKVDKNETKE